ncbi:MAG: Patatin [SAR86 cluster bacterium]|uniref:Patatin n=1 Tax=SAR86 cluster bacterium TaxID=2030880 RepID=A0A2A5B4T6_9GAMM|nr:MAG: Patatin [SAR86 cluster bacterium]
MLKQYNADRIGLILSGGGARAAYQVGVLRAIANILPKDACSPFHIISGTSAGALNAASLASHAHRLRTGVRILEHVWKNISSDQVYVPQSGNLLGSASSLVLSMVAGKPDSPPLSLLDNTPLASLLSRVLKLERIQGNIDKGFLDALSITASAYSSGESVSFYQGIKGLKDWSGPHRVGRRADIKLQHLLASSAIPVLFPATQIENQYYGDGAVRQLAPTSTAIHLGARRILAIGVSGNRLKKPSNEESSSGVENEAVGELAIPTTPSTPDSAPEAPSLSQIIGHILNSAFVDTLENDLEFLRHMNEVLPYVPEHIKEQAEFPMHEVDLLEISPTKELNLLAAKHYDELPKTMSRYVKGSSSGTLLSLVLFEKGFCTDLMKLGFEDAMEKEQSIAQFFKH